MISVASLVVVLLSAATLQAGAFSPRAVRSTQVRSGCSARLCPFPPLRMSEESESTAVVEEDEEDESMMDEGSRLMREKMRRADELRSQEVFMTRSTGLHRCTNCDFEYDQEKGDTYLIGGMVKPGTAFAELPTNWRCPTCRASKDAYEEVVVEIPGFAVNQGYGFGFNSMTGGAKTGFIFGGLGLFFVLFLSGYAMS